MSPIAAWGLITAARPKRIPSVSRCLRVNSSRIEIQTAERDKDQQKIFALKRHGWAALQIFQTKENCGGEGGRFAKAAHDKKCDDEKRGENGEVEDANAKTVEAAEEAKHGIGDETAWHLKVEEVAVWDETFGTHEEGFVKKRRFVVRDGPLQWNSLLEQREVRRGEQAGYS